MISVVLPVYNEAENILRVPELVEERFASLDDYEIIVVDDGSVDSSEQLVVSYSRSHPTVRLISYGRNRGKGYALRRGLLEARGASVFFLDSDLDINIDGLNRFVEALGVHDVVIASKWARGSKVCMPISRRVQSKVFNFVTRSLTGLDFRDTQVGFKAIRREALEKVRDELRVDGFAFDVELLLLAKVHGLSVAELPIELNISEDTISIRDIWRMLLDLLDVSLRHRLRLGVKIS